MKEKCKPMGAIKVDPCEGGVKKEKRQNRAWDAKIVLTFKLMKMRLSVIVVADSKTSAETKAIDWGKKYVTDNYDSISKSIGYDAVLTENPKVQVFKTSYCAFI